MGWQQLSGEITKLRRRADELREDALGSDDASPIVHRALAELMTSVEELRVAEEELREQNNALVRANAAIERERRHYADLFENAPVPYATTDTRGVLREVNRAVATLLKQPPAGLVGKPLALLVDVEDRDRFRALCECVTAGELAVPAETLRLRMGEHSVRVRIEGTARAEAGEPPTSCLWVLEDIAARELAADAERISADSRRKDEFLAMLGHELRNPLAPIRAAVELWRHHAGELTAEQRQWTVDVVSRQADHLAHLVDDLLDVSRVTHGKIRLRKSIVDLREIVEQSRDVLRAQAQLHHVELVLPAVPLRVDGDAVRLRQVVVNLLDNALKFTPRGGRIVMRARIEAGRAVLVVSDNGIGIAPELRERVFGMFTQGEHTLARASGGLGLGLPLVRRLVELHGGTVQVRSPGLGKGSEFEVALPIVVGKSPTRVEVEDDLPAQAQLRLLLVDDNVDGAEMLGKLLGAIGHLTTLAFDGASAIEVFQQLRPDAVLLDLGLPDIDGLEVARHMKRLVPTVHLVAITGFGDDRIRARVRDAGFAEHLLKPVEIDALRRALAQVEPKKR